MKYYNFRPTGKDEIICVKEHLAIQYSNSFTDQGVKSEIELAYIAGFKTAKALAVKEVLKDRDEDCHERVYRIKMIGDTPSEAPSWWEERKP